MSESTKRWLRSKNSTLWGRAFDIKDEDSLEAAATWFEQQVDEYNDHVAQEGAP